MNLLGRARELGQALTETREYTDMRAAEAAVAADDEASAMLDEWNGLRRRFVEAMTSQDGSAEEVSERMQALKEIMAVNPYIAAMEDARKSFSRVIESVNDVLRYIVGGEIGGGDGACGEIGGGDGACGGGACEGCGGGCYLH